LKSNGLEKERPSFRTQALKKKEERKKKEKKGTNE
jgi:hypothetical protein